MPFDNFYEESDKNSRRWWKIVGLAFFLVIGYSAIPFLANVVASLTTPTENEAATRDKRAERVNELCKNLPRPENFQFSAKDTPKNYPDSTLVVYHYESDREPEEIMPIFLLWFDENDWKSIAGNGSIFRKGKQTVSLEAKKPFHIVTGYAIQCSESE